MAQTKKDKNKAEVTAPQQPTTAVEEVPSNELQAAVVTASRKPKYGRFFRGNESIEGERAYKALFNANRNAGGWGMTNMALKAIEDGNDVYRGSDGSIMIKDTSGNDITDKYIPTGITAKVSDGQGKKNWGATFNSKNHRFRVSGEYLDTIDLTPEDTRVELRRGTGNGFFKVKDSNGNEVYDTESKQNQDYESLIRELISYAQENPAEASKKYKYSNWKEADRTALQNLGNEFAADPEYADKLIEAVKSGNLTDAQKDVLTKMGIFASSTQTSPKPSTEGNSPSFALSGINEDAAKSLGITGIKENTDENGNKYYTIEGDQFANSTWDLYGMDSAFGKTDFNNGWIHNGRLYKAGDENKAGELQNAVRKYMGIYMNPDETFSSYWGRRTGAGVRFLGDSSNPLFDFDINNTYDYKTKGLLYNYFKKNNIKNAGVTDVSRYYGLNDGSLYGYINTGSKGGIHNNPVMEYIDSQGNKVNINKYTKATFPDSRVPQLDFSTLENGKFKYGTFSNKKGNATVSVEWNPATNQYTIYRRNNITGEELEPYNIHSSQTDEFLNYLNSGEWENYRTLQDLRKAKPSNKFYGYGIGYIPSNKEGGKINWNKLSKLAGGGIFGVGEMQGADYKIDNSKVSEITNPHAIDGSDRGLTKEEQLQIAAAIGDVAGVAMSFIPGGVGKWGAAGTGVASSITRLKADSWDGIQAKDIGSFLGNIMLDAATVIPVLGTGPKAYKALKAIKAVGQPLIKWLSLYGASQSVLNAAGKAIRGEKITGTDMANLISGIGSATIAAKSVGKTIGDAKLAKQVDAKAVESFNKNVDSTKVAYADGFLLNKKPKEIETFVKEAKTKEGAISKLKELATTEGKTLSDKGAEKILQELGINETKGKVNFSFKDNSWKKLFLGKSKPSLEFEVPTEREVGSLISYLSPRKRVRILGWDGAYGFPTKTPTTQIGNSFSSEELQTAINNVRRGKATLLEKALVDRTVNAPDAFGVRFRSIPVFTERGWTFGGSRYYRNPYLLPANKKGGVIPKAKEGLSGGFAGIDKKPKIANTAINILPGLVDTLDLGRVLSANSKYSDTLKEAALKSNVYATAPTLNSPKLNLSSIEQGRNNARNLYLSQLAGINPTSDTNTNRATTLAASEAMLNLDNKVNEQITNAVTQNNASLAEINNQNRINEANTAYQNAKQNAAVQSAIARTEGEKIQSIHSALSDFGQQSRSMLRAYRAGVNDLNTRETISNLNKELENKKEEAVKTLKDEYNKAVKAGTITGTFDDWITSDTQRSNRYLDLLDVNNYDPLKTPKDSYSSWYNTVYLPAYKKAQMNSLLSHSFKKGGKIKESILDEIAVENSKMSKQALLQMNKELLSLLNKLLK